MRGMVEPGEDVGVGGAEEVFFHQPLRYYALGCTDAGRYLFVAFTTRGSLIR